ncbi:MAG: TonB-dependent receptor [Acidobacteria bacterium]|nr:MAG: TonB-dependent receptor [Acidobacteriota bacterium]
MKRTIAGALLLLAVASLAPAALSAEASGRLEGKVVDAAGAPLPGARVVAEGPARREGWSAPGGTFALTDLPPGTYRLVASLQGFRNAERTLTVAAAGGAPVTLTLEVGREEALVVTASRVETRLADAPATVSVLPVTQLEIEPARSWADVLRTVPGVNATQTSAREVNVASRSASAFFNGSQMALVDGRPLYFDFFNIVFWDLSSVGMRDLEQVEVLRGPASVMWGANAASGVVNLITKSPRQTPGLEATITGGVFTRPDSSEDSGNVWGIEARWAGALSESLSARLSAGFSKAEAYARPTGNVFVGPSALDPSVTVGGGSYDAVAYDDDGTQQPRVDLRVDQKLGEEGLLLFSGGYAGTEGVLHTPIGPFQIERGARLVYGRASYTNGGLRVSAFANDVRGQAPNLVTPDATGQPLRIDFANGQYDLDGGYSFLLGKRHLVGVGANVRYNSFDLDLAPLADRRLDYAVWAQDEIDLEPFRVALALRVDKPENVANALVAPRVAVAWSPASGHVVRASYSRGYRTPSSVENYLDVSVIGGEFPLGSIDPRYGDETLPIVTSITGSPDLDAETLDAWELSWQGQVGTTQLGLNVYLNESDRVISNNGTYEALAAAGAEPYYTSADPPAGWPFPPQLIDILAARGVYLPKETRFLNLGSVRNQGVEVSVVQPVSAVVSLFANYSFQDTPELGEEPGDLRRPKAETVPVPARHRLNFGGTYAGRRWNGSVVVNYGDRAYFADVLSPSYYGWTRSYLMVNAALGVRWGDGRVTTTLRANNLTGQKVQQHIFGDVLGRTVALDVGLHF